MAVARAMAFFSGVQRRDAAGHVPDIAGAEQRRTTYGSVKGPLNGLTLFGVNKFVEQALRP
jgi:hypothetical protein